MMLVIVIIVVARMLSGNLRSRLDSMPLSMAAKSLLFLAYMMLSSHYKRGESLKAYMVSDSRPTLTLVLERAQLERCTD